MKKFFKWLASLPKNLPAYLAYVRKAIIQILGLAAALLALGLLPSNYAAYVATGIGILTTVLHYLTPNASAPAPVVDNSTLTSIGTQTDPGATSVDVAVVPADSEGGKHEATDATVVPPSS